MAKGEIAFYENVLQSRLLQRYTMLKGLIMNIYHRQITKQIGESALKPVFAILTIIMTKVDEFKI